MFDMIIRNGTIIDGSGGDRFIGDIAVKKDRITAVGRLKGGERARKEVDARGLIVSPGIVDIHTHADLSLARPDSAEILSPLLRQGITTVVGGNCGFGLAPFGSKNADIQKEYISTIMHDTVSEKASWRTMGQWMEYLEKKGTIMNTALLAPHGLMRMAATGRHRQDVDADGMRTMKKDLEASMEAGAFGLSTGLQYYPGIYSTTEELHDLSASLVKYDGVLTCHLRSYTSSTLGRAMDEVFSIIGAHGIRGQVSHIFALPWLGPLQKPYLAMVRSFIRHADLSLKLLPEGVITAEQRKVLARYHRARKSGLRAGMDVMPTSTGFTPLLAFFPSWIIQESLDVLMARLSDPAARREIKEDILKGSPRWPHRGRRDWSLNLFRQLGYECSHIMGVLSEKNRPMEGRPLLELAREAGKHPIDFACDLLLEERGRVVTYESFSGPDDPFTEVAQYPSLFDPEVSIVTDTLLMGYGRPSRLFYGAFPRFYGYFARDKKRITLEAAVRKCTSLPASQMGISGRGLLREGCFADMLLFDEARISTAADFDDPRRDPEGVRMVVLNGRIVVEGNAVKTVKAGRVLRRGE